MHLDHSKIRNIELSYEEIIIGSSLSALIYCYKNNVPFFYATNESPGKFSYFEPDVDLSSFGLENKITTIRCATDKKEIGIQKQYLWEKLYFFLSLAGLNPMSDKVASMRIKDNTLYAFTGNARSAQINFNRLKVFSTENITGIGSPVHIPEKKYKVYDWVNVRNGTKHDLDWIEDEEDFVKSIFFYITDRIDGDQVFKDACAVSYLSEKQLNDYEYSDIAAKFKILHMMKSNGMKGPRNGYNPKNGAIKYRPLRIEMNSREVHQMNKPVYESNGCIEFMNNNEEIINESDVKDSYVGRIFKQYNKH